MKSRTRRPFQSIALTGSVIILGAFMLPACGADTDGVFQSTAGANTSSSSGNGGEAGAGQGGNGSSSSGQGGMSASSSSGQGGGPSGSSSSSGQGGSAGQSTSSSSSSSSSSSGSGMPEDCLDGLDNDLDGDIDCADSDCTTGFTCTDEAPTGWTSVALEQGMGAAPMPMPCPDGTIEESLFTGPAGPAECSACTCGALAGNTCNAPTIACFPGSNNCGSGQQDWTNNFANGNCAKPDIGFTGSLSCRLTSAATVGQSGACPPSMSDFGNKDTWAGWVQSCGIKTGNGGCGTGKVCTAKPLDTQSLCIRQDGQQMCPGGWNPVEAYLGGVDDRSCAACSCTSNASCTGGTYQVFDSNGCAAGGDNPITIDNNTCRNVSALIDFGSWSIQRNPPMAGGSCTPQGGEPTGSVQPKGPVTFCCK